ncbi:MAG: hypothetical protein IJT72_04880 [Lachnospiraceae bacterium]|nr:hypothetical protein [Lachnospiraceae bacterium]
MTSEELIDKLNDIQIIKSESKILEIKAANQGCPKRLFDTLSAFSNQDDIRPVSRAPFSVLDSDLLEKYIKRLKENKVNLGALEDDI